MPSIVYSGIRWVKALVVDLGARCIFGADEVNRTPDLLITNYRIYLAPAIV